MNQEYLQIDRGEIVGLRPRRYRRILWSMVALATAAVAMLLASPEADADRYSYLDRLVDAGFYGSTEDSWVQMGYAICNAQSGGVSNASIAADIVANTGAGIYTAEAYKIIAITNQELCTGNGGRYLV